MARSKIIGGRNGMVASVFFVAISDAYQLTLAKTDARYRLTISGQQTPCVGWEISVVACRLIWSENADNQLLPPLSMNFIEAIQKIY